MNKPTREESKKLFDVFARAKLSAFADGYENDWHPGMPPEESVLPPSITHLKITETDDGVPTFDVRELGPDLVHMFMKDRRARVGSTQLIDILIKSDTVSGVVVCHEAMTVNATTSEEYDKAIDSGTGDEQSLRHHPDMRSVLLLALYVSEGIHLYIQPVADGKRNGDVEYIPADNVEFSGAMVPESSKSPDPSRDHLSKKRDVKH